MRREMLDRCSCRKLVSIQWSCINGVRTSVQTNTSNFTKSDSQYPYCFKFEAQSGNYSGFWCTNSPSTPMVTLKLFESTEDVSATATTTVTLTSTMTRTTTTSTSRSTSSRSSTSGTSSQVDSTAVTSSSSVYGVPFTLSQQTDGTATSIRASNAAASSSTNGAEALSVGGNHMGALAVALGVVLMILGS